MAEQFDSIFKRRNHKTSNPSDDNSSKSPNKSEDQFDLFGVSDESSEENHHKYYKTLQDTEHSYQIIQGDLGLKLLQNLSKQSSVCFDTDSGLDALHAELVGISFSYEKERIYVPFRRIRLKQKHSLKIYAFSKTKNRENWTEFEI
jgi:DNA polymerase-1